MDTGFGAVWKRLRIWALVVCACMLLLGAVMIVYPDVSARAVCIILGIVCISMGALNVIRYVRLRGIGLLLRYDLVSSVLSILVGLLLLVRSSDAVAFFPVAIGIYMLIGSLLSIQLSVELHRIHNASWLISLLWGIVGTILAFILLIDPFGGASLVMIFSGISLIVGSIEDINLIVYISKAVRSAADNGAVTAQWTSIS